jgi:DNA-binding NarL/FixJ family response regulator
VFPAQGRQDRGLPVGLGLLDDHELVGRGVRDLIWTEEDPTVVGEASTAVEAH